MAKTNPFRTTSKNHLIIPDFDLKYPGLQNQWQQVGIHIDTQTLLCSLHRRRIVLTKRAANILFANANFFILFISASINQFIVTTKFRKHLNRCLFFLGSRSHSLVNLCSGFSSFVSFRKGFVEIGFNLILKRLVFVGGDFPVTIPVNEWE